ncbi:MAG: NAD(P)H-dependent oxidoreductase subunit E [Sedimentisphaerales bacterium]|nr:NAD(P)H-dependent oxidoreductase subunit E [Sedimentisphaerales bacterium]MBN2843871.1 NAD(P)H-dependent oxidoreductase subunit E [Sedimentisphaerales bacterium]
MITVEICMGTTCFVLGGDSFSDFEEKMPVEMAGKVELVAGRCLGLCRGGKFEGAPYVKINGVPVGNATPTLVLEILHEMLRSEE